MMDTHWLERLREILEDPSKDDDKKIIEATKQYTESAEYVTPKP